MSTATESAVTETSGAIELKNIGAIERLTCPIPEGGAGLIIVQGRNGSGKSTALRAIGKMLNGDGDAPTPRDGYERGEVKGLGAKLTVAKSTRRSGELEFVALESGQSPDLLVDPGINDPIAADARRVKSLISLTGLSVEASEFYGIVGGKAEFDALFSGLDIDTEDDPLKLASRLKRSAQASALEEERQADTAAGEAAAHEAAGNAVTGEPVDVDKLNDAVEAALKARHVLTGKVEAYKAAQENAASAREKLNSLAEPESVVDRLRLKIQQITEEHDETVKAIVKLQGVKSQLESARSEAESHLEAAIRRQSDRQSALALIESAAAIPCPTAEEISKADDLVQACRDAVTRNTLRAEARNARVSAGLARKREKAHREHAAALREAASRVDGILSDFVAKTGSGLIVRDGRLMIETARGMTLFADLSHGERWKVAIDVCVNSLGATGILTIPQEAWEGLDDNNRQAIVTHLKARGVLAITAEAVANDRITAVAV